MRPSTAARVHVTPRFALESGEILRDVRQAYVLEGTINEDSREMCLIASRDGGA